MIDLIQNFKRDHVEESYEEKSNKRQKMVFRYLVNLLLSQKVREWKAIKEKYIFYNENRYQVKNPKL